MNKYKLAIFDMDGTLFDTLEGIKNSHFLALKQETGVVLQDKDLEDVMCWKIPNTYEERFNIKGEKLAKAVDVFREIYGKEGIKQASLYPNAKETIIELKKRGYKIALATMKIEEFSKNMLEFFGIDYLFDAVFGKDRESKRTKADVINMCLQKLGVLPSETVMVGDTLGDEIGAKESNVDFIAVTYGFGFKSESDLRGLKYVHCVSSFDELSQILLK